MFLSPSSSQSRSKVSTINCRQNAGKRVCSFSTRLGSCNSVLVGVTQREIDRLQKVQNAAARLVHGGHRFSHVTPLLRDKRHWLRVRQRIKYKLCLIVHKAFHGRSPAYIKDLVVLSPTPLQPVACAQLTITRWFNIE